MSLQVLYKDTPQPTIALVAHGYILSVRQVLDSSEELRFANSQTLHVGSVKCFVDFSRVSDRRDLAGYRRLGRGYGAIGLIALDADVFLCIISSASRVATPRPGETVQRIEAVEFYCLNRAFSEAYYGNQEGYEELEAPYQPLEKLLSDGSFFYSADFDLTNRLQERLDKERPFDIGSLNQDYLWNSFMIAPLLQFRNHLPDVDKGALDSCHMLTSAVRGFVQSLTVPSSLPLLRGVHSRLPSVLTLISRLSSRRAGTRFNSRGIDDEGNVSNFVETEVLFWIPTGITFSYAQVRGSVPIFWEQAPGNLLAQQRVDITRSPAATQPAFDKHFEDLELTYGAVHVVNLLSKTKPAEVDLSNRYDFHIAHSPLHQKGHALLEKTYFDFHAETRGNFEAATLIRSEVEEAADGFAYCLSEGDKDYHQVVLQQEGVFRTNCLDCLDRTNLVQTIISRMALEQFFAHKGSKAPDEFWRMHSTLWADNGDLLSKSYAGTGALKSSFTRSGKMSFAGALSDATKSAARFMINNFSDKARQRTIELLLGRLTGQAYVELVDPVNDAIMAEVRRRAIEYCSYEKIRIWVGTFNLNAKRHDPRNDLSPWLLSHLAREEEEPGIVAVAFQEIVSLNAQQIMSTDPENRRMWEEAVVTTLNKRTSQRSTAKYVLLRSGQLVGAALLLVVKEDLLRHVKNVEGSDKKTGLSGMAGNKGGCAIRLELSNTRLCFVTAHLAAGFANYEERNDDYQTISKGLRFQRNRTLDDHDCIIWFGDFNYRIGQSGEKVRRWIRAENFEALYEHDQLNLQMMAGLTFPYYSEGRITFPPTYKFDIGTDTYDTSEKARVPAWCDRVLWKGKILRQLHYCSAPLRFSDHRPVYATFECTINVIDEERKAEIRKEAYQRHRHLSGSLKTEDEDVEDLIGYEPVAPGLPPASTDKRKWWLEQGMSARSGINAPAYNVEDLLTGPNPFAVQNEAETAKPRYGTPAASGPREAGGASLGASSLYSAGAKSSSEVSASSKASLARAQTAPINSNASLHTKTKKPPPIPTKPTSMTAARVPHIQSVGSGRQATEAANDSGSLSNKLPQGLLDSKPALPTRPGPQSGSPRPPQPRRSAMQKAHTMPLANAQGARGSPTAGDLLDDEAGNLTSWEPLQPQ